MLDRRHFLALSGAALAMPGLAGAADSWDDDFAAFVAKGLADTKTPGLGVAMVKQGRTILARGYGMADIAAQRPVNADTLFHIASVSKTVTATAAMMLAQDGRFGFDDAVNDHLDFKVVHPRFPDTPITIRQLMTHTSGIDDKVYYATDAFSNTGDPVIGLRDFLTGYLTPGGQWYDADGCFAAQPGTVWKYSNVAVALLGYLAGRFGDDLKALTQKRLFAPLGMHDTSWTYAGLDPARVATPYNTSGDTPEALPPTGYPDWPAGLLRTSPNDFARFLAIYTTGGALDGTTYLSADTLTTMLAPQPVLPDPADPSISQALIWSWRQFDSYKVFLHGGGDPGASTLAMVDPDHGTAILIFANGAGNADFSAFRKQLVTRMLDRAAAI